ncbi:MAG: hypothetical protein ACI9QN_002368 [Arcticibacterium sp.]|jgi:hypothetical protein
MSFFKKTFKRLSISGGVLIALLFTLELALSWVYDFPDGYYTNTPNKHFGMKLDLEFIGGVHDDVSSVSFNSLGARSEEVSDSYKHKILAIGGSTTLCIALTQEKTWTQ